MARTRHAIWRMFAAALGLAFGIFGSELTFGQLRAEEPGSAAVLYSIELRNGQGDLLASPLVVGQEGRHVHLNLAQQEGPHSEPLAMSLDLDPQPMESGLCLGFKLVVGDGFAHQGRVAVPYGQTGGWVPLAGREGLRLSLRAARAHTPEFDRLMLQHRNGPAA
jgi:hypothetical protein